MRSDKRSIFATTLGASVVVLLLTLGPAAASAAPGTNTWTPITGGISAKALPGAKAFGTTPTTTPEAVSIILKEQNLSRLEADVDGGMKSFLSVGQFATTYGQPPSFIAQLDDYLGRFGITTSVYADDVDVKAYGTAGEFDTALSVHQREYHVAGQPGRDGARGVRPQTVHSPTQAPQLPYRLARDVEAILGLDNYGPYVSRAVRGPVRPGTASSGHGSTGCVMATPHLIDPDSCHTPSYFATQYGLDGLYSQGAKGQGVALGIVTLAPLDTTAPAAFWKDLGIQTDPHRTLTVVNVDGGPAVTPTASGETDLDVEQSGALAPDANVIVYQAPDTTTGFADGFFAAASANLASTVSSSWGLAETMIQSEIDTGTLTRGVVTAFDEAFLELAAQGESTFIASGDTGAYTAYGEIRTTNLSVDDPADSPYVTASGGTTTPFNAVISTKATSNVKASVSVSSQRTWGWDYLWAPIAKVTDEPLVTAVQSNVGGSGGGYSVFESMPSYQQGVPGTQNFSDVEYLTPIDYETYVPGLSEPTAWVFTPNPKVEHGTGTGRAMPDVSTDADPLSGYLLYAPTLVHTTTLILDGDWGGTSFVAPQLNGSTAVIDSLLGHRVGLWNPWIYSFATGTNSPFTPLDQSGTSSDNIYYTGTARTVYNPGSGLGYPNLTKLAADFASQ
jgi:kumamolisin